MAGSASRFLIVRRDNIGDLACTTPLLDGLRAQHPQAWIGVLANSYNAEVLARNPVPDAVYVYEKLKHRRQQFAQFVWNRLKLVADLRGVRLDVVLVPAPAPQTLSFARSLRPGRIIASEATDSRHEVERTYALGKELGVSGTPGPMHVYPDASCVAALRDVLTPGPRIAVHISARRPRQQWPLERYAALIGELAKSARVTLLWSPGSRNDARHPGDDESATRLRTLAVDAVPTPDLATLIAALSLADCVVCPDGGAMHLAAALGKPVVALFGDSPVERWRPWGVPHLVVRPSSGDLADLGVEPVLAAHAQLAGLGDAKNRAH